MGDGSYNSHVIHAPILPTSRRISALNENYLRKFRVGFQISNRLYDHWIFSFGCQYDLDTTQCVSKWELGRQTKWLESLPLNLFNCKELQIRRQYYSIKTSHNYFDAKWWIKSLHLRFLLLWNHKIPYIPWNISQDIQRCLWKVGTFRILEYFIW